MAVRFQQAKDIHGNGSRQALTVGQTWLGCHGKGSGPAWYEEEGTAENTLDI